MESRFKVCSKCGEDKPKGEFHKDCRRKDGLRSQCKVCVNQYRKHYYQECREQHLDYMKQYYQENRGRILEYGKQRHQEYREQNLKYKRQWRRENPDYDKHWHQDNREQRSDYMKQWRQENLEKVAASSARRRVLKLENTSDVIANCTEEKGRVEKIYKLRQLLTKATGVEYHVDHIWPLSKGGPHWSGNLQIITAEENLGKGNKLCEETARVIQESLDEYYCTRQRE